MKGLSLVLSSLPCRLVAALVIASSVAGQEPEKQKESDWVDARWNQTDLGNFHASIVPLPNGIVAKGLSVRVGEHGEAAVVYDTESLALRAGWTGGFLKFNGSRYGLIRSPEPAGVVQFVAPAAPPAKTPANRWSALHVHGPRVLLTYRLNGVQIEETPWWESTNGLGVFTRTIRAAPSKEPLEFSLIETKGRTLQTVNQDGTRLITFSGPTNVIAVVALHRGASELHFEGDVLKLVLPPTDESRPVAKLFISMFPPEDLRKFTQHIEQAAQAGTFNEVAALSEPGPARWRPLTTRGQRGFGSDAYVIDTLTVPYDNPWKALFFTSGVDFLPNGDAAVCTIHGDVWRVSGIDDKLDNLTWRRFATGLFQPLGLRVRDGAVFVLGRDQITRLTDVDGDGEADNYENFFNGIHTSTGGHDYVTSLEADTNGNFYYVDPRGLHRVSADGAGQETIAAGFRNPNGMGASPDGSILTVAPQQGEWTPSSLICEARAGGWYGYGGPKLTSERPLGYDAPLCWIPHRVDNSGGSQLWVTSDRWGPLRGQLLHFSFGRCSQFLLLREVVDGVAQGAIAPLPGRFLSGAMRGAFNPRDGQLYVVGSRGWQTAAVRDGCLQRARFTGATLLAPVACHAHSNGLRLTFAAPLDRAAAEDTGSYAAAHWNYRYAAQYGSKDYSPSAPNQEGHDPLEVRAATLSPDGRSVFLEIPGLRPVMQWEVKFSLRTADAKAMRNELHGTINRLAPAWRP